MEMRPVFKCGDIPWRIHYHPYDTKTSDISLYLAHGYEDQQPENWAAPVEFALVLWSPGQLSQYTSRVAKHCFNADEGDWGFTRFCNPESQQSSTASKEIQGEIAITAYVRVIEDPTGVLWHTFRNYDSKKETGMVTPAAGTFAALLTGTAKTLYYSHMHESFCFSTSHDFTHFDLDICNHDSFDPSTYHSPRDSLRAYTDMSAIPDEEKQTREMGFASNKCTLFENLPWILHLHLKRAEYDAAQGHVVKIRERQSFPMELDLVPFFTSYERQAAKLGQWVHQLAGVVVHDGDESRGHFHTFVRPSGTDAVYRFDHDERMTRATVMDAVDANFGSSRKSASGPCATVYMLVYVRK
ncbi:hypothetical protein NUU61_000713 [Penicillium alfredii]|uniref:USP domain-containing protein n=1 Tax=Penicillium alfredii TaxID=1506179 RepID=A0A9W9GA41_9EURO|nr:uncharacterized protein NUU61_000713 [Penicillium alfredii]KAJ5114954.1 hypothetical protein NUU61_000713 [Penicillium alfredii]